MPALSLDLSFEDAAMSDLNPKAVYKAYSDDQKQGPLARPLFLARILAIAVAVMGAIPTGYNYYLSWQHGIPYNEVSHRLSQYDLWVKNFECKIDYRTVGAGQGMKIDVGACPTTKDIALKVTTPSGKASYEWIAFEQLEKSTKSASVLSLFVSEALADEAPKGDLNPTPALASRPVPDAGATPVTRSVSGSTRFAQATTPAPGLQVVCQAMPEKGKIIRIVNEGGKCFREHFSAFQGRVEKREEVQCNTPCGGKG
jgi:hypothetical protein